MAKPVGFSREGAQRIADAVRRVEGGVDPKRAGWHAYRSDGEGEPVRLGKTEGYAWAKGTVRDITLYERGEPPDEQQNIPAATLRDCVNKFADIEAYKWVMLAKCANDRWYVIAAEC